MYNENDLHDRHSILLLSLFLYLTTLPGSAVEQVSSSGQARFPTEPAVTILDFVGSHNTFLQGVRPHRSSDEERRRPG